MEWEIYYKRTYRNTGKIGEKIYMQRLLQLRRGLIDEWDSETPEYVVAWDVLRLRVDERRKRCSVSSLVVRLKDEEAVVFDRRRLCTIPCIFGRAVFRAASMNLTRGDVRAELLASFEAWTGVFGLFANSEDDAVVIEFEGRISWNVAEVLFVLTLSPEGFWSLSASEWLLVNEGLSVPNSHPPDSNAPGLPSTEWELEMGVKVPYSAPEVPL